MTDMMVLKWQDMDETTISYIRNKNQSQSCNYHSSSCPRYYLIITMNIRYPPNIVFSYSFERWPLTPSQIE